jgi:hypothetical protein
MTDTLIVRVVLANESLALGTDTIADGCIAHVMARLFDAVIERRVPRAVLAIGKHPFGARTTLSEIEAAGEDDKEHAIRVEWHPARRRGVDA